MSAETYSSTSTLLGVDLLVEGRRGALRSQNLRRVEELFSVSCSLLEPSQQGDWVRINGNSSQNLENAKCYIMAMCCPQVQQDMVLSNRAMNRVAGLLFAADQKLRNNLERTNLTFIQHLRAQDSCDQIIRVQGQSHQVTNTLTQLRNLIDTMEKSNSPSPSSSTSPSPLHQNYLAAHPNDQPPTSSSPHHHRRHHHHHHHGYSPSTTNRTPLNGTVAVPTTHKSEHPLLISRDSPAVKRSSKMDYFVQQLGFPPSKVEATLEALGWEASDNDVLNRLMMKGVTPDSKSSSPSASTGHRLSHAPVAEPNLGGARAEHVRRGVAIDPSRLRPIVIDGSNVAMRHGNGQVFSCRGIQIAVEYFQERGHKDITVFVPEWRKENSRPESPITDQHILEQLERERILVYTPSRKIHGKRIVCYDDRYIVKCAHKQGGVIVSNDQFRDLMQESQEWKKVIEQRLLQFAFVNDYFMPPDDPLGKSGPTLDHFLSLDPKEVQGGPKVSIDAPTSSKPICPHLGNCTFGPKCRYFHPDREPQPGKQEKPIGSGSSGGSYTPSTVSSRSATPSPSPDSNRSQGGMYSSRNSHEDLYGSQFSQHGSSDDLHRGGYGDVPSLVRKNSGLDISELSERLAQTGILSPSKVPASYHPQQSLKFQQQSRPLHVVSGPVLSEDTPTVLPVLEGGGAKPQNHTFPMVQLPSHHLHHHTHQHHSIRAGTEEQQHYHHHHMTQPPPPQTHGQHVTGHMTAYEDAPANYSVFVQPPHHHNHGFPPTSVNSFLDHHQPSSHIRSTNTIPSGGRVGVVSSGYPTHSHAHHQQVLPQQHNQLTTGGDQSIPLQNLHHLLPPNHQPPSQSHHHGYNTHPQLPGGHYQENSYYHPEVTMESRHRLYCNAAAVLPNCEDRIHKVMRAHPELKSEEDLRILINLVEKL